MISIVYASTAVRLFNRAELVEILEHSKKWNTEFGITGLLLYKDGNIMQVIEGEEEHVLQLYENIKADPRHRGIIQLAKEPIASRQFGEWQMGFVNIDQLSAQELEGFSEFLSSEFTPEFYKSRPTRAYILLLSFKDKA